MQAGSYHAADGVLAQDEDARRASLAPLIAPGALRRTRVLVVDERPLVRMGVNDLLRCEGIDVVGDVSDARAAVTTASDLGTVVVLMHLAVTGRNGAEAVRLLAGERLGARVIVVASANHSELLGALAAGACGAVVEDAPVEEMVAAILAADRGEAFFSPPIARALMRRLRLLGDARPPELTARELQVLELLARGWGNARIAEALCLSVGTVKHHISSILAKLNVDNRIQAAVRAVHHGLIGR